MSPEAPTHPQTPPDESPYGEAPSGPPSTAVRVRNNVLGVLAAILLTAGIASALHARVALDPTPAPRAPMPVLATQYTPQTDFSRPASSLGVVVAARRATLGFEMGGKLLAAPPREGTPVSAGDVIATLDQTALLARRQAIAAQLQQVTTELELAQLKAKRQKKLRATGATSKDAVDETRLRARALDGSVAAAKAQLASIDIELEKSTLRAPYDGTIANRYQHQGAIVSPGTPVVTLLATTEKEAHIGIGVEQARDLSLGHAYKLRLRGQLLEALLVSLRPDVNPQTRATTAVFQLPSETSVLDGEPVTLELTNTVHATGAWLPISALAESQRGLWMVLRLVATEERTNATEDTRTVYQAERETVEVLDVQGDRAYVRGTLPDGSLVVADGMHRIIPGSRVVISASEGL